MRALRTGFVVVASMILLAPAVSAEPDFAGSKDHPLFTRMPNYFIADYLQKEYEQFRFDVGEGEQVTVEGRFTHIIYQVNTGATLASPIQIARNYQNAIKKVGGTVLSEWADGVGGATTMKLVRGTDEIWARLSMGDSGFNYVVDVVEEAGMNQEVTANAEVFRDDIRTTGHAAVYGIYFDTDQSVVKPESEPALKEVARLLQSDPKLSVRVVGHTDSTGDLGHNVALSEARAKAVVAALTSKHGVAAARLTAHGVGPLAPVASNDSDEGRAKNRRVELVKK